MLKRIYKHWIFVFLLMLSFLFGMAQQQYHFIYIQSDNQQPFYVKYGGKNYSSTAIGYLILPKLSDGAVSLQIGFAKNLYPEQNFNLTVAGKDLGFALKNFGEKGWGLFNFQTTDIVMNGNAAAPASEQAIKTTTNASNAFGNMLASAINDSTLNQQRVAATDSSAKTKVPDNNTGAASSTTVQTYNNVAAVDSLIKKYSTHTDSATSNNKTGETSNPIVKSAEKTNDSGTDLTFLDNTSKDTIHAFIPSSNQPNGAGKASSADSANGKVSNPFFNNNNAQTVERATTSDSSTNVIKTNPSLLNTSCTNMFSSGDADKLKRKILSLHKQEDIMNVVRKNLRGKCITTDQVKDLGNLFLSDENRYNFYDAAYPYVYDFGNYDILQNTLIDSYYRNRFKALLH